MDANITGGILGGMRFGRLPGRPTFLVDLEDGGLRRALTRALAMLLARG